MDKVMLYKQAVTYQSDAREKQYQILRLELENDMLRVKVKYDSTQTTISQVMISHNLQLIDTFQSIRDEKLGQSITIALKILEDDLKSDFIAGLSPGKMLLDNIVSFIDVYKIPLTLPVDDYLKASLMLSSLELRGFKHNDIRLNLEKICKK